MKHVVLWLACRHHVLEIIAAKAFTISLNEKSIGPEIELFSNFKKQWGTLNIENIKSGISDREVAKIFPKNERKTLIDFLKIQLTINHERSDYKDLAVLGLLFLGEEINNGKVPVPGAVHRARWMARIIGSIRIFIFRVQLNLNKDVLDGLRQFVCFIMKIYIRQWFNCQNPMTAPKNDLDLLKDINNYKKINKQLALEVLKAFSRHLWYLNEHNVGLSFFDDRLDLKTKKKMVENLKKISIDFNVRPKIIEKKISRFTIPDFITINTMEFFKILEINTQFLSLDPKLWPENHNYLDGLRKVGNMKVVNDIAERCVSMMSDFNNSITNNEEQKQYLLQVVENHRKNVPMASKSTIIESIKTINI